MFRIESGKKNMKPKRVITSGDGSGTRRKPMGNFALSKCFGFFFFSQPHHIFQSLGRNGDPSSSCKSQYLKFLTV